MNTYFKSVENMRIRNELSVDFDQSLLSQSQDSPEKNRLKQILQPQGIALLLRTLANLARKYIVIIWILVFVEFIYVCLLATGGKAPILDKGLQISRLIYSDTLFKVQLASDQRPFVHYHGFHTLHVGIKSQSYSWNETGIFSKYYKKEPRQCSATDTTATCLVRDWIYLIKLILERGFINHDYVWILEDDTFPCPLAETLLVQILHANPLIKFLNTGIGATGLVMNEQGAKEFYQILHLQTDGPDLAIAQYMRPLPHRLAISLVTHKLEQSSTIGHDPSTKKLPACYELQTISGIFEYDLFDWKLCSGYDIYPCTTTTSRILSTRQLGYLGTSQDMTWGMQINMTIINHFLRQTDTRNY